MPMIDPQDPRQCHLGRILAHQAAEDGGHDFLIFDADHYSFARANALANRIAHGLRRIGIAPGERLSCYLDSCPEYVLLALAANKIGAVWIPVNTDYKGEWLRDTIERSHPQLVVTNRRLLPRLMAIAPPLGLERIYVALGEMDEGAAAAAAADGPALPAPARAFHELLSDDDSEPDQSAFAHSDTCAVMWTSGTTGRSKGVMQSHNVWVQAAAMANGPYAPQADDIILNVMPLYNSAAWVTAVLRALVAGISCAVDPHFSVADYWQRVRHYGATQAFTLGAMHMFLWNAPPRADDADNPMRVMQMVPIPDDVRAGFAERFGVRTIGPGMSQSEAMMLLSQNHDKPGGWPPNCCGSPVASMELKLVDDSGAEVPPGEPGELWARARQAHIIFNGYLDDPAATAAAFDGEWLKTGDMLRRDADDNYFFVDRKKDAVRYKGRNISTYEVEAVARAHPAIADCAAFGIPSAELESEDELKLNVVFKEGAAATAEELAEFINDKAPHFFVPRYIELVDASCPTRRPTRCGSTSCARSASRRRLGICSSRTTGCGAEKRPAAIEGGSG